VGVVRRKGGRVWIEIFDAYRDALLGLEQYSHIVVIFWFHKNDTPQYRRTLRVHPRRNPQNPLTGVFATHSPKRPNLLGLTCCRCAAVEGTRIRIDAIDALDGSPVIDIKGFIPDEKLQASIRLPAWV
jgi:tRNA-Thr(GGU) m(6)t(6)A37 methyltransferase TsaA